MTVRFDTDVPAGCGFPAGTSGHEIRVRKDCRDTRKDWFYWCFRLTFDEPGEYTVSFVPSEGCSMTERGPAFSLDGGMSWSWLPPGQYEPEKSTFRYFYDGGPSSSAIFCTSMQYLPAHLNRFLDGSNGDLRLRTEELCRTRKGRSATLLRLKTPGTSPPHRLLLTSRHHCCEMTATYVLEGILREALDKDGLLDRFEIAAVPFVDTDGVIDGDQGKERTPHDHGRDYRPQPVYPETAAIMKLIETERPDCVVDLHCPYVCGKEDSRVFLVGTGVERIEKANLRFSRCLEADPRRDVPYFTEHELPFGAPWNKGTTLETGMTLTRWASEFSFVRLAPTFEIPYANSGGFTFGADSWRSLGRAMGRALLEWAVGPESS